MAASLACVGCRFAYVGASLVPDDMQTVDMVIAGVGVAAILATTLGLVFYDEAAGIDTVTFQELDGPTFGDEQPQSPGAQTYTFALPMNATQARADITVAVERIGGGVGPFSGSASAFLRVNGTESTTDDTQFALGNQQDSTSGTMTIPYFRILDVPMAQNTTDLAAFDASHDWGDVELEVVVTITGMQSDAPGGITPPQNNFVYTVTIAGDYQVYKHVLPALPDPATA